MCWSKLWLSAGSMFGPLDPDERVAVLAALLVPQPDRVPDLVDRVARRAAAAERDVLAAPALADHRRAAAAVLEVHEVRELGRVRAVAQDEPDRRVLLPVRDRVRDPLLVRHPGVDVVRHLPVGPSELLARDADRCQGRCGRVRGSELLDRAEDDVALEDRRPSTSAYCSAFWANVRPPTSAVPAMGPGALLPASLVAAATGRPASCGFVRHRSPPIALARPIPPWRRDDAGGGSARESVPGARLSFVHLQPATPHARRAMRPGSGGLLPEWGDARALTRPCRSRTGRGVPGARRAMACPSSTGVRGRAPPRPSTGDGAGRASAPQACWSRRPRRYGAREDRSRLGQAHAGELQRRCNVPPAARRSRRRQRPAARQASRSFIRPPVWSTAPE